MAKAQATYDECYKLQLPFTLHSQDKVLISQNGIAKVVTFDDISKLLAQLLNDDIAKQIYDSLAKVAHTGSYYDLIDVPPNAKNWIFKAPNGTYWQLNVDNQGDLNITKALVPDEKKIPDLIGPNGKHWEIKVNNDGDMYLIEVPS